MTYQYICKQGPRKPEGADRRTVCTPNGHRTRGAAERCCERLNSSVRSIGMLRDDTRWRIEEGAE